MTGRSLKLTEIFKCKCNGKMFITVTLSEKFMQLECAFCGDENPRQCWYGWRQTMYEVSRKYHFTFPFDSALCTLVV